MKIQNIFVGLVLSLFVVFGTLEFYNTKDCPEKLNQTWKNLNTITRNKTNTIDRIVLKKYSSEFKINLVDSEQIITDTNFFKQVRLILSKRGHEEWNRPSSYWKTKMIIYLKNGQNISLTVSKLLKNENKTHLYFGDENCHTNPQYSHELGLLLENETFFYGELFE